MKTINICFLHKDWCGYSQEDSDNLFKLTGRTFLTKESEIARYSALPGVNFNVVKRIAMCQDYYNGKTDFSSHVKAEIIVNWEGCDKERLLEEVKYMYVDKFDYGKYESYIFAEEWLEKKLAQTKMFFDLLDSAR